MADTVPAMLEPGEYVIRKDAAEEIGIDNLNMMNNIDRSSQMYMNHGGLVPQLQHGHSAIDELLAINTLSNQANVDMTRQSSMMNQGGKLKPVPEGNKGLGKLPDTVRNRMGYMQDGGKVPQAPDLLQINPRMRGEFKDMGTIGVVDPRQELIDNLNTLQNSIRKEQHFKRQGKDAYVKHQKESGEILSMDSIMDILNSGAQQTALMFKDSVQGYNNGGTVGYGDQTSNVMTLEDIYQMTGQRVDDPTGAGLKEYDASREEGALADYSRQVGGLQQQGMGMIGQATQQAQGMGGGFAGFGGRQSAVEQARTQAQRGYQSGIDQAQQNKFETIRSMREGYTADIIGQIGQEEAAGGTTEITEAEYATTPIPTEDPNWNPPTNPTPNATYNFGNQVWQFIRRAGPGGEMGQGQWIRQN